MATSGEQTQISRLIARARCGEKRAFDELFTRCRPQLELAVHWRLGKALRRRIEVDDVLQETFLTAFESIDGFHSTGERAFHRWLARIAENLILQKRRYHSASKRQLELELSLTQAANLAVDRRRVPSQALVDSGLSPLKQALKKERLARLAAAIDTLEKDRRDVVILARIRQLPMSRIAKIMHRNKAACSMLLLRAIRDLEDKLQDTDHGRE